MTRKKLQKNKKRTALKDMILRTDSNEGINTMNNAQENFGPKKLFKITVLHFKNVSDNDKNGNLKAYLIFD